MKWVKRVDLLAQALELLMMRAWSGKRDRLVIKSRTDSSPEMRNWKVGVKYMGVKVQLGVNDILHGNMTVSI